jgi:DNA invertase Pin-like site-specific DNA recombinase
MNKKLYRCAVYTRKSTEDGLEQDFNSLDAQREACEAYILSQGGLGWQLVSRHYDDGGISGATMERPALRDLLDDIADGKIDIVVVYKIDRLTRALMDFARMVELFDKHDVSFVSVTQQFNTTTSMGRLTLNVLLSFAQFEREVTAERIRDKITASKKKGMWMGGPAPLGYDVHDRKLIINEQEAQTVRMIYRLYLECKGVRDLKTQLDHRGVVSKVRTYKCGRTVGGNTISRGALYLLLSNPIYIGRMPHKGETYEGQHQAIINQELWADVQALLTANRTARSSGTNAKHPSLLAGLLYDETGDRLSPTHANNHGKRYRFYISHRLMQDKRKDLGAWRLPAAELEALVINGLTQRLSDHTQLIELTQLHIADVTTLEHALATAKRLQHQAGHHTNEGIRALIRMAIRRIDIRPGQMTMIICPTSLTAVLLKQSGPIPTNPSSDQVTLTLPFQLRRRGVEAKLIVGNEIANPTIDPKLVETIRNAHRWLRLLSSGNASSVDAIAELDNISASEISRILALAFLAPDITKSILTGNQPIDLTAERLKRIGKLPACWNEQRRVLRMPS